MKKPGSLTSRRKEFLLTGIVILVCLLGGESLLRVSVPHVRGSHQHPSTIGRDDFLTDERLGEHHPLIGWKLRANKTTINQGWEFKHVIKTNSKGFRDDETPYERRPNVRRILLLGDSFAMGDGVARRFSFADVLEKSLENTEVVNLAVSAYGTDQEFLTYLTEGKKYEADIVLLTLTIANDFENNASRVQYGLHKPYYELVDGELRLNGTPVPETPLRATTRYAEPRYRSPFPVHDFFDAHSALYAACFEALSRVPSLRKRWEAQKLIYRQEGVFYSGQIGILNAEPSPEQEAAWRLTLAILKAWKEEALREKSKPVLVLIPSHLQVYPDVWKRVAREFRLKAGKHDLDYPNGRLGAFCRSVGLEAIDLLPDFRQAAQSGETLYYKRNPHWNRKGHLLAAEVVARRLGEMGILE